MTPADAPLDPSADQARRWLTEELAGAEYHAQPSLLERLREWVDHLLDAAPGTGLPAVAVPVAVGLVLAALALVLWRVLRRDVGSAGAGRAARVLDVPDLPASALRARAREALARGHWDGAVLDGLRAIARGAVERVVLDDAPGRTAHEVAAALAERFPAESAALAAAADRFDAVRYGHRRASEEAAHAVLALDERLETARPVPVG
ncbi:DUF4129 domain-containing protein [Phycicoccus endophyticus]|uniref:DUF4129 domain-containing protein n=1 Tax=Phycicoccus endophyticus TaxID=1690220 RepID=A0A7G9R2W7_9MICO|nr:DUF4129 domain-containing protein [Phycicoccus endophyticus]NHI20418.1 DUF4129 domain-containing protein [Phycicoccus endophyticus]QNN49942.1 DUF4129 domain-containing protein [Phycicoccus endophyticus]